jgi:uncharacterized protein
VSAPETAVPVLPANLLRFVHLLRRLGWSLSLEHLRTWARALTLVDLGDRAQVRAASRAVLVAHREQLELFDRAFDLFFRAEPAALPPELGRLAGPRPTLAPVPLGRVPGQGDEQTPEVDRPTRERQDAWSPSEALRQKDFAALTAEEAAQIRDWLRSGGFALPARRTRRSKPSAKGPRFDLRRTLRRSLGAGGELVRLVRARRKTKPRPLVAICDVSGSMEPYSRVLLELLYALTAQGGKREAFAFGTRLTRLTRLLAKPDADEALRQAARAVVDWGGGTRMGEALRRFNVEWGKRVLGRGAVVLLVSDGLDRGDLDLLERELAHLARKSWRLLWLNPLLGLEGYEPKARAMKAALPHLDAFLPIHNLASLEDLARVLGEVEWVG